MSKTYENPSATRAAELGGKTLRQLRQTFVRDLTPGQCRRLLVHNHGYELHPMRRKAYLLKANPTRWQSYFSDSQRLEIEQWIGQEKPCPNCKKATCDCRPSEKAMAATVATIPAKRSKVTGPLLGYAGIGKSITTPQPVKLSNAVVKPGSLPHNWFILATVNDNAAAQGQFTVAQCQRQDIADAIAEAINHFAVC